MSPPPDLARKVSQLDNDVGAIYNMLNAIQTTQQRQGNRIDEMGRDVAQLRTNVAELRTNVAELSDGISGMRGDIATILALLQGRGDQAD